jgi:hypothetical protein
MLLTAMRASAHHAFAVTYDEKSIVTISGVVTRIEWINPHAWLYVRGKDANGKTDSWRFEMGAPGGLISRGFEKTAVKKGDPITVDGFRAWDGSNTANARFVTLQDGRKLFGGFATTPGAPVK